MSAPDTNALPPAPVTTSTRTSSSLANSSRMRLPACHISSDTALCRAGLLKIMVPTRPSLRESILSVVVMCFSLLQQHSPPHHAEGVSSTRRGEGLGVGGATTADVLQSPPP